MVLPTWLAWWTTRLVMEWTALRLWLKGMPYLQARRLVGEQTWLFMERLKREKAAAIFSLAQASADHDGPPPCVFIRLAPIAGKRPASARQHHSEGRAGRSMDTR